MNKSNEKSLRIGRPVEYTVTPPFPRNMVLVPNNLCNHTCVFCGYAQIKQKPVSMPLENALRFIDEAYSLGTREIGFCAINEPFMYKYLEELVIHAKKTGYEYTYITTNGALATKDRMRTLIAGGLDSIKFSVNAGTAETYKKIHGKDEFDKVIQNIFDTIALRNTLKKDLVVFASCVETNLNSSEIEILKNVLRGGGVDRELYVYPLINNGGTMNEAQTESNELGKANKRPMISSNCWWGAIGESGAVKMCNQVFNRFHITPEGYFSICGAQRENLLVAADVNKLSLLEAWTCEIAKEVRKYFIDKYLPVNIQCYNCQHNANIQAAPLCDWAVEKEC